MLIFQRESKNVLLNPMAILMQIVWSNAIVINTTIENYIEAQGENVTVTRMEIEKSRPVLEDKNWNRIWFWDEARNISWNWDRDYGNDRGVDGVFVLMGIVNAITLLLVIVVERMDVSEIRIATAKRLLLGKKSRPREDEMIQLILLPVCVSKQAGLTQKLVLWLKQRHIHFSKFRIRSRQRTWQRMRANTRAR